MVKLTLSMQRTNWKFGEYNMNIPMLGVRYSNVAIPLMFKMLDKRGNSNTAEGIELIQDFIDWFGNVRIDCLLAYREFMGDMWLEFINRNQIRYHIRIPNNFHIFFPRKQTLIKVSHLFAALKINEFKHYEHIMRLETELC